MNDKIIINLDIINKLADKIKNLNKFKLFDFYSSGPNLIFPDINKSYVIDFFFFSVLHQFGFWYEKNNKYFKPMYAYINKKKLKGSEYLWASMLNAYKNNNNIFDNEFIENCNINSFKQLFADDNGKCPIPMIETHFKLHKSLYKDLIKLGLTPEKIVTLSNQSKNVLKTFLNYISKLSGYKEDPLQKKSLLLALCLTNRPEHFLKTNNNDDTWKPIVDYHIQRSLLRTGAVEIIDNKMKTDNINRVFISESDENLIRSKCYQAFKILMDISKESLGKLDYFFYLNRINCPETKIPECKKCVIQKICKKNVKMFQPIIRTTFY